MKRIIKIVLALAAVLLALYVLLRWQGLLLFWDEPAPRRYETFGVDVSNYQGTVNWPALVNQGVDFAFLKATEGSSLVDRQFSANWANARAAGVLAGAYHFFSYDSPGGTQADNFIATVPVTPGILPPVVDIEFYGEYLSTPKPPEEVWPILDALLSRLESHYSQKPILYVTNESYRLYVAGRYDGYPLWCTLPFISPFYAPWTFWQYSHHATLDGYDGAEKYIDLNVFRGTMDDLRAMLSPAPVGAIHESPAPAPASLPENTVQKTFRPASYMDELTVAVTYGDDNIHTVTISQGGEVVQTIAEEDEDWLRSGWRHLAVEDMNFDGYLDFRFSCATFNQNYWEHVYLYDPYGSERFYKAEELDRWCQLRFDQDSATVIARDSSGINARTTLIKWTGEGYVPRRRIEWVSTDGEKQIIVSEYRPDAPRLLALEDPEEAWAPAARWETTGDADEETAPWLDPDYFGPNIPTPTEIPQDLTDFLLPLVAADTWRPFAQQFAAGKELDSEMAEKLFEKYTEGWAEPVAADYSGTRIDADNDGTMDAFICSVQGTGRFCSFDLLRGQAGGGYVCTDSGMLGSRVSGRWISWNGSRYLLVPDYDYDTRAFTGLDVYLFQDGKITRRAWLERQVSGYELGAPQVAEGYESVLADLEDRAADQWTEFERTWEQPMGTAERTVPEEKNEFLCDLDNDGAEERYSKGTASVNVNGRFLSISIPEDQRTRDTLAFLSSELQGNLQLMWVDQWNGENLIYIVDCFGDQPIRFQVYRSRDGAETRVASLTLTPSHTARLAAYETDPELSLW